MPYFPIKIKPKRRFIGLLLLFLITTSIHASYKDSLTLWYRRPAQIWDEALPIGNGRLGAMVFVGLV